MSSLMRSRWAAIGAAIAVTLGGGGLGVVNAIQTSGERATYVPITPCRLLDTRAAAGVPGRHTPVGPGETHTQSAHGDNGQCTAIPADATALTLNVTALDATSPTYLTFWPADQAQPNASHLNPDVGAPPTPNAVNVDLSAAGQFKIFNERGSTGVIVDITGYYVDHNHDDRYPRTDDARIAYAWNCLSASAIGASTDLSACGGVVDYHFNPSGGPITVTRLGTGQYVVSFTGLQMTGGHVQVTAYGSTSNFCKLYSWGANSARVDCYTPAGDPADEMFSIMAMD